MKKRILLILALLLTLCTTAIAHPGRTDDRGGHYDHDTGQYHYHHGYEAHQHTGGACPFDFDDRTGENSGSSSFGGSSSSDVAFTDSSHEGNSVWNAFWRFLTLILITPPILFFGFLFFVIPVLLPILQAVEKRKEKWNNYAQKTRTEIAYECGMPHEFYIDKKDLPHKKGSDLYSDLLTVHMELHRRRYHSSPTCTYSSTTPVNVTQLYCCWACPKCRPPRLDLSWYNSYMNIRDTMERRGIEPAPDLDAEAPR